VTRTWKILIVVILLLFLAAMVGGLVAALGGASAETSEASTPRLGVSTTATLVASTTTLSPTATGTQATTATATGPEGPQPLDMVEAGFSSFGDHNDHMAYAAIIRNPNPNRGTSSGTLRITLHDASGGVITYDQTFPHIMPGQTIAWAGALSMNGQTITGTGSEVLPLEAGEWIPADQMKPVGFVPFEIVGLTANETASTIAVVFTGSVVNNNSSDFENLAVSVLVRDQWGHLVGGGTNFVENVSAGGKAPFEVSVPRRDMLTHYASYEAYAQIW
jgi:hypothetical protein